MYFDYMARNGHTLNPETDQPWRKVEVNAMINDPVLKTLKPLSEEKIEALESFFEIVDG